MTQLKKIDQNKPKPTKTYQNQPNQTKLGRTNPDFTTTNQTQKITLPTKSKQTLPNQIKLDTIINFQFEIRLVASDGRHENFGCN